MSKLFIPFITAGYPTMQITQELITEFAAMNIPYVELGIPYSDPVADGPKIQRASELALEAGTNLDTMFAMLEQVAVPSSTKLILFSYYNPLFVYGFERFCTRCRENGVFAVLIPDLPLEEEGEVTALLKQYGLVLIPLVAPTSQERLQRILQGKNEGFVYCVSSLGVTGERQSFHSDLQTFIAQIRAYTSLPIAVGFGISNRQQAEAIGNLSDGVVVGSKIINIITSVCEQMYGSLDAMQKEPTETSISTAQRVAKEVRRQIEPLYLD